MTEGNISPFKLRHQVLQRNKATRQQHRFNPTLGVKSDFEKLLSKFTETKSVRYEEFAKIWRELKMSLIFAGRQSDYEAREFVEDCYNIALNFLMPPFNFQVRVGALYILYGLYLKQPCRPLARIRMTEEQWNEMKQLLVEVREQKHLDSEYVYTVLEFNEAFTFVATSTPMYPFMRDVTDDDTQFLKIDALAMLAEQKSILSEILEPDNIDQLSAIHEHYHRLKCQLNEADKTTPKPSMNVVKPNLVQYITKSVTAYEEKRKIITGKKPRKRRESGQTTTSESELDSDVDSIESPLKKKRKATGRDSNTGARRAEIKARAFAGVKVATRSRRHRQTFKESDDATSFSSPSPKKPKRRIAVKTPPIADACVEDDDDVDKEVESFGKSLRNSLLSMPTLHEAEGSKPEKPGRKKGKANAKNTNKRKASGDSGKVKKEPEKTPSPKGKGRRDHSDKASPSKKSTPKVKLSPKKTEGKKKSPEKKRGRKRKD